jgi:hypothetical protein
MIATEPCTGATELARRFSASFSSSNSGIFGDLRGGLLGLQHLLLLQLALVEEVGQDCGKRIKEMRNVLWWGSRLTDQDYGNESECQDRRKSLLVARRCSLRKDENRKKGVCKCVSIKAIVDQDFALESLTCSIE